MPTGGSDHHLAVQPLRREEDRLVTGDRGRLAGRGQKGGEKVCRTLLGKPGSRFHLAVDRCGLPLAIRLAAGNENERRHLLPLIDALESRGIRPRELWADRGYDSRPLREALRERRITPHISERRRSRDPIPPEVQGRMIRRGGRRTQRALDPQARHRWPVERTNSWLKSCRRVAVRRDRKASNYLAFLHLAMILILVRSF